MRTDIPNYHLIEVNYLGATNFRASRIRLTSHRFSDDGPDSVLIDYDQWRPNLGITEAMAAGIAWLKAHGYAVDGTAETRGGYALLSSTFEPLKLMADKHAVRFVDTWDRHVRAFVCGAEALQWVEAQGWTRHNSGDNRWICGGLEYRLEGVGVTETKPDLRETEKATVAA